ncbi:MAG: zinc-ribbon domain containing protein [Clostridia bacterium]|nr:zinc-ribbon domain containing protein [Clostridia bacterium]
MYEDKTLVCKECGQEFVFTAGEQEFYAEKGFQNEPKRCKSCRNAAKGASSNPAKVEVKIICDKCGGEDVVHFQPSEGKPVYCRACYNEMLQQKKQEQE